MGSNSIGWALLGANTNSKPDCLIDLGVRIFPKAVESKTPTPKNVKRRQRRLARRVIQRRARRKQRMCKYLISLGFLPDNLNNDSQPEITLNKLGDPYQLRAQALDRILEPYELGRVLLHLVQRRGFLSNRKTLLGREMLDDPDVQSVLVELKDDSPEVGGNDKEETAFKKDISEFRKNIESSGCRTLGEYLSTLDVHQCKRNRDHIGGYLRTDRQMYQDELTAIYQKQAQHHSMMLNDKVRMELENIIFHQRPLKLKENRVGKCSLEKNKKRCQIARLEYQEFRYLQDINHLSYIDPHTNTEVRLSAGERQTLVDLLENNPAPTFGVIKRTLDLGRISFNLETGNKKLMGNRTACTIREVFRQWDNFERSQQADFLEDLLTIRKKTALKKRLMNHWKIDGTTAIKLCMLEFEPGHGNLSAKAINKILPFLQQGMIYSDARETAGYSYESEDIDAVNRLRAPPEIPNPIVQKGLHELRRVVNAIIAEYGKPDVIRIEMARDLEMNTKRYKAFLDQQKANTKANDEASKEYQTIFTKNPGLNLSSYPSRDDKIKYRLWKEQDRRCAYSNCQISLATLFTSEIEVDHILPYSQSMDDSYMNKVVCYANENRYKGNRTPIDAYGGDEDIWNQIHSAIQRWNRRKLGSKINRFYKTASDMADLEQIDFSSSQLNDTRYISRKAGEYLKTLGSDITCTKGKIVADLRHHWYLNSLIGPTHEKERTDHRHHAIDAVVIACVDRGFHQVLARNAKSLENRYGLSLRDLVTDPPWKTLRTETEEKLNNMIVSHVPQRKISGALHEETGVGFNEHLGSTVYRKKLDGDFKLKHANSIIDPVVRQQVIKHLGNYENDTKKAFAEGITVFHKDNKTPIYRVRMRQAATTRSKLEKSKFGIRNNEGEIFRWMAYGNIHHVEIVFDKKPKKYKGIFVTAMEAAHRARGIKGSKRSIIQTDHGAGVIFMFALHINDLVSIEEDGQRKLYRVQKLASMSQQLQLRLHTAALIGNSNEEILKSVSTLMAAYKLQLHSINAIGKLQDDQADHRCK